MKKLVQFGAGNIGRSFIGQLFARAGWEVVFIDIDEKVIQALNERGEYVVQVRDRQEQSITVRNVRGVSAYQAEAVAEEICTADIAATAVGQKALGSIVTLLATGIVQRSRRFPGRPLDIIICENMHDAASFLKRALVEALPAGFPFERTIGLVETSIGKMVPIMSEMDRARDPLLVFAEAYNTLILDRKGFKGEVVDVPGLDPKDNIRAYVDRKLFIHNMGHAVCGYTSFVFRPANTYVWEAADDEEIREITRNAMHEAGDALIAEYPDEFTQSSIGEHIEDLLIRFRNKALGDTIYRLGRDLYRKLGHDDRLVGSLRLCEKHGITASYITLGTASAMFFRAVDEKGGLFEGDARFHKQEMSRGADHVIKNICKLQGPTAAQIRELYEIIESGERNLTKLVSQLSEKSRNRR
jgi:mannitol-1-phosphate 5-dehydrogenase